MTIALDIDAFLVFQFRYGLYLFMKLALAIDILYAIYVLYGVFHTEQTK